MFVSISLYITQYLLHAFDYGAEQTRTFLLVAGALSALYYLLRPVLKITSLPSEGFGYLFLLFALTFAILFVLTLFIPAFAIKPVVIQNLIIFGFMLPSKSLTSLWAGAVSAVLVSLVYMFLQSISSKK